MERKKGLGLGKRLAILGGILAASTALSSGATQYIAGKFNNDPALGAPLVGPLYPPFSWVKWQYEPWARNYASLFKPIDFGSMIVMTGLPVLALVALSMSGRKPREYEDVHGSARFMTDKEVMASPYVDNEHGVYIGAYEDKGEVFYLRHDGAEHIAAIAPTRSGKGVGLVLPTLLSWPSSSVIFDEKGELWELTSGWRKRAGNAVLRWQPGAPSGSAAFNFLSEVRIGTPYEVADVQNVAVMLIDPEGKGFKDHWDRTGFALLSGLILHVMYCARKRGAQASLPDVASAISDPKKKPEQLYDEMAGNKHLTGGKTHKFISESGAEQLNREEKERGSVHSTVTTYMQLFRDPLIVGNSTRSDFKISDLMDHTCPVSLYIVVTGDDKVRLKPLVRLMLTQIIRGLTGVNIEFEEVRSPRIKRLTRWLFKADEAPAARLPKMPHKHRLLMMMDEFPSLGRLAVFEDALAKCAGFGIKAYIIMQDREQLLAAYHHETILSNSHIRVVYAPNKYETADWISKELDSQTINLEVYSESGKRIGPLSHVSRSITQTGRALMTPGEIMRLPAPVKEGAKIVAPGVLIVLTAGNRPILGRQILYFQDPVFAERAAIHPPAATDSLAPATFALTT